MNLINGTLIDLLLSTAESFRSEICRILEQYKRDRDIEKKQSERYKDESSYYNNAQRKLAEIARNAIAKAERVFSAKVMDYSGQMEEQLKKHLSMPVNTQFREKLSMLSEFGIQPEKIEIDDLISLNGGNQIGLTALAKTLKKVESPYALKYHTTAEYQNDLAMIRDIPRNLKYIPNEYHSEGCEIYKGLSADYVYPNGKVLGNGISYDSVSLIQSRVSFESSIDEIKKLKDVWSTDCSYGEADKYYEEEQENQDTLNSAGLPVEKMPKPNSGITIVDDPENSEAIKIAKQMGIDAAKRTQNTLNELLRAGQAL